MTLPVEIRPAQEADRAVIETIQSTTLADPTPGLLTVALDGPMMALVAVDHTDTPVGYLLATTVDGDAYVPELAVSTAAQGQGVGTALLSTACRRLASDGVEHVRLTARASDDRVREFYENRGFEEVDRIDDHYVDDVDGLVYERHLD